VTRIPLSRLSGQTSRRQVLAGVAGLLLVRFAGRAAIAAPQTFMIFFDKDSAELVPSAKPILAAIETLIKPNARITIAGHCDTSESDPNKLSTERAKVVHEAFMDFIFATKPQGVIFSFSGKGTSEPQKQTGPNVPEPLNRYVSITVQ
jgi:outer membrane protein OmpA-like peptidoglycan-associated protein